MTTCNPALSHDRLGTGSSDRLLPHRQVETEAKNRCALGWPLPPSTHLALDHEDDEEEKKRPKAIGICQALGTLPHTPQRPHQGPHRPHFFNELFRARTTWLSPNAACLTISRRQKKIEHAVLGALETLDGQSYAIVSWLA